VTKKRAGRTYYAQKVYYARFRVLKTSIVNNAPL
jgi:hypothetical protein